MSLAEELVLLRLHEATHRELNSNLTVGVHGDLAARRRAVRDAKYVLGRYGAEGGLAWDHAEPIRFACDEEALKVRFESREQDQDQDRDQNQNQDHLPYWYLSPYSVEYFLLLLQLYVAGTFSTYLGLQMLL